MRHVRSGYVSYGRGIVSDIPRAVIDNARFHW